MSNLFHWKNQRRDQKSIMCYVIVGLLDNCSSWLRSKLNEDSISIRCVNLCNLSL